MSIKISNISELVLYALEERKGGVAQKNISIELNYLSDSIIKKIKDETNIDLSKLEYKFGISSSYINHCWKNHSNPKVEAKHKQIAVQVPDIYFVESIFNNPDRIEDGKIVDGKQGIKFIKNINNKEYTVVAKIRESRKKVSFATLYIKSKTPIV